LQGIEGKIDFLVPLVNPAVSRTGSGICRLGFAWLRVYF
jgi:hypothetical protein